MLINALNQKLRNLWWHLQSTWRIDHDPHQVLEDSLAYQHQRLQQIIRATGVGTWEWNVQTGEVILGPNWAAMLGYSLAELAPIGLDTWERLTHPDDLKQAYEAIERHWLRHTEDYECEMRMRCKSGHWLWIQARGQVISRTADGEPLWMVGTHADITVRKNTEIALYESRAMYQQLVEKQPDLICWFKPDTTLTFVNSAYAEFFATTPEQLLGQRFINFLNPKDQLEAREYLASFTPAQAAQQSEHVTRRADGVERWHLWRDFAFFDDQEQLLSFQSFGTDITDRKQAEMALQYKETQLRNILSSVVDAILTIDAHCTILSVNAATERMFGYSAQELIGANVALIMPNQMGHQHDHFVQRYLSGGDAKIIGIGREVQGRHRDGSCFPAELAISEFEMQDQRFFTGIIRDISEHKHYEAELIRAREAAEAANQAKSAFLAAMSHEIRTPMNGVIGLVDLLRRSPLSTDQQTMLATIKDSAFSLLGIIDEILDFSKIEADKLTLERTAVSLAQIVEGVGDTLQPLAMRKQLVLHYEYDPALPAWVYADSVRLRQILFNLTGNAVKFTHSEPSRSGWVRLRARCRHVDTQWCRVHFQISDNGIGIASDKLSQLFQPFSQAESSTTRRFGGTGLGLSICSRLVAMMGGRITVTSQLGEGSTFEFELEFERAAAPPSDEVLPVAHHLAEWGAQAPSVDVARSTGQLILVAEDNETNQTVIRYQLHTLGYAVEMAQDGLQALERLRTGQYALLLTDYHMPSLDGLALIAAVREMERYSTQHLPIVMLTANAIKGEAEQFLSAGADEVLTKPVVLDDMQRVLRRWMPVPLPQPESPVATLDMQAEGRGDTHQPPVDTRVLERIVGDDPAVVHTVLQEFLHTATVTFERLHTADGDAAIIHQQAHRLKSSARSVGALHLGELCQALEDAGQADDEAALSPLLAKLNTEWRAVEQYLHGYIQSAVDHGNSDD